jgi:hypothetical protein
LRNVSGLRSFGVEGEKAWDVGADEGAEGEYEGYMER